MYREQATDTAPLFIVAFKGKVFGLHPKTGAKIWRVEFGFDSVELLIDGDLVVAADSTAIAFIDYATGDVRKVIKRNDVARTGRAILLANGPYLLVGGTGELACYTRDGEFVWDEGFPGEGYGAVALGVPGRVRQADVIGR